MTGNELRRKVCDIINTWDGSTRGDAKHQEILAIYNAQNPLPSGWKMGVNDAHCATTVSAAYLKAGIAAYTGTECGVQRFVEVAKKKGIWTEDDAHVPSPGDAIVYDWQDSGVGDNMGYADHIGLVTACDKKTMQLTEGNINGGKVGKLTKQVNSRYIRGYITPDFDAIARALTAGGSTSASTGAIGVGCKVKVKSGASSYSGQRLASWVYATTFQVIEVKNDRVVIGVNGVVTAAVRAEDLSEA